MPPVSRKRKAAAENRKLGWQLRHQQTDALPLAAALAQVNKDVVDETVCRHRHRRQDQEDNGDDSDDIDEQAERRIRNESARRRCLSPLATPEAEMSPESIATSLVMHVKEKERIATRQRRSSRLFHHQLVAQLVAPVVNVAASSTTETEWPAAENLYQ